MCNLPESYNTWTPLARLVRIRQSLQRVAAATLRAAFASGKGEGLPPPMPAPARAALAPAAKSLLAARPGASHTCRRAGFAPRWAVQRALRSRTKETLRRCW